jgi:hypothetical protein
MKAIKGSNKNAILKELYDLGLLHKNNGDRYQSRFSIVNSSGENDGRKLPFYSLSVSILSQ